MDEQIEVTHPDWCQDSRCTRNDDGSITHRHSFGEVSGIEVVAERHDEFDPAKGRVKAGSPRAYSLVKQTGRLTGAQMTELNRLHHGAEVFVGRRSTGGVL